MVLFSLIDTIRWLKRLRNRGLICTEASKVEFVDLKLSVDHALCAARSRQFLNTAVVKALKEHGLTLWPVCCVARLAFECHCSRCSRGKSRSKDEPACMFWPAHGQAIWDRVLYSNLRRYCIPLQEIVGLLCFPLCQTIFSPLPRHVPLPLCSDREFVTRFSALCRAPQLPVPLQSQRVEVS